MMSQSSPEAVINQNGDQKIAWKRWKKIFAGGKGKRINKKLSTETGRTQYKLNSEFHNAKETSN